MKTPVAMFVFNRPDNTRKVFDVIRQAKPERLFVIADGPRDSKPSDHDKCLETLKVVEQVDWNCKVSQNYSEVNLGCRDRVATGISWVFEHVDRAIFLEDDNLPHPSFFQFCDVLLEKYKDDERVMSITGTNLLHEWKSDIQSYHFANYFNSWGFAIWKRAWELYDLEMKLWGNLEVRERVRDVIANDEQYLSRKRFLDETYEGKLDSYSYPFFFACLANSGLTITPALNLVKNTGFSEDATHTKGEKDPRAKLPLYEMHFPLRHPPVVAVDRNYDNQRYKKIWKPSLKTRMTRRLRRMLTGL